jgi:hypothetical protein
MSSTVPIENVPPYVQIIAAASQTVFDTNFTADVGTDIVVYDRADGSTPDDVVDLVDPADYLVTFVGVDQLVRVTFLVGRTEDDIVTIMRATPVERLNLYINTNFTPSMLNGDFGKQTMMIQEREYSNNNLAPKYNNNASVTEVVDTILPVLGANETWAKNDANTAIIGIVPVVQPDLDPIKFIVQEANATVPAAQSLGALSTGILKNNDSGAVGTLSIDAAMTAFAGLSFGANKLPYATGATSFSLVDFSPYSQTILPLGDLAAWQAALGIPGGGPGVYLPLSGGTMAGAIDMSANQINDLGAPVLDSDAATKGYVLSVIENVQLACLCATEADLPTWTYNNGTAGVGATLTAPANGATTFDGIVPVDTNRILVINQTTNPAWQGAYTIVQGTGGTPTVLTRATDYDTPSQMDAGDIFSVVQGTVYGATQWMMSQVNAITIGTTAITFEQITGQGALLIANNLSDLSNTSTARTNLGLGTAAVAAATDFASSTLASGKIYRGSAGNVATATTAQYPDAAGTLGNVMTSDGTNWVSSTPAPAAGFEASLMLMGG